MADAPVRTSQTIGVALEATVARVAANIGGKIQLHEMEWDANAPDTFVDRLRGMFGNVRAIALSVGLGFLEIAKPELPPMSTDNLHRVLRRDADRYFPLEGAAAISGPHAGGVTYAISAERLHRLVRVFETWAPVRSIVAAPNAIAAALALGIQFPTTATAVGSTRETTANAAGGGSGGTQTRNATPSQVSSLIIDADADEFGLVNVQNGAVTEVRRIATMLGVPVEAGARYLEQALLDVEYSTGSAAMTPNGNTKASGKFAAALGARELLTAPLAEMLLDASLEQIIRSRRVRRQWGSYALLAASVILVAASVSVRRTHTLRATQQAVDSLSQLASPGIASQKRLAQLDAELRVLTQRNDATRDPLSVVSTLSRALPADAFVERITWDGTEWRLDGSANQAAAVVPHLDSAGTFVDVRVLSASTRFRDGARMRESFSVAFKVKGDSSGHR